MLVWARKRGTSQSKVVFSIPFPASHEHVVFAKGTIDEPAGDCPKCDTVFNAGGYADEFDSKESRGTTRQ